MKAPFSFDHGFIVTCIHREMPSSSSLTHVWVPIIEHGRNFDLHLDPHHVFFQMTDLRII